MKKEVVVQTKDEIRRNKVLRLLLQGKEVSEISEEEGIDVVTLTKDINILRKRALVDIKKDVDRLLEHELARMDYMEELALKHFFDSVIEKEETKLDETLDFVSGDSGISGKKMVSKTKATRGGNPKFLELAMKIQEQRRKLLGLGEDKEKASKVFVNINWEELHKKPQKVVLAPITHQQQETPKLLEDEKVPEVELPELY